jgi:glycosyltransferase involved in cell wall biosynthesis
MKVNIGVVGRFHAFDLAKQLQKYKLLNKLITTYPKFKVKEWEIESDKIVSEIFLEILRRYGNRISYISKENINKFISIKHAKYVISYLNQCDIYIGWSGSSLETLIEAKKRGVTTILERGSTHYTYQQNILFEEFNKYGLKFNINYDILARELLEYELCDYISIPSSFVKRTFMEKGIPENKLLVNPYGVDLSNFKQIPKEDKIFRVIFCGTLSIQKGSHYLLQAFYELNLPNSELWHIGSIKEEMKTFMKKYQSDKIIYKGHYPQNELYKLYSQGNVFCIPSLQEGMAMVQLQAMACGLPLICTTNTGGDDLITKNGEEGFVIPIRDVNAIKEKILYLYENQDICYEMGQKAKQRVSKDFSWDDYGKRYFNNLKRIYNNKK